MPRLCWLPGHLCDPRHAPDCSILVEQAEAQTSRPCLSLGETRDQQGSESGGGIEESHLGSWSTRTRTSRLQATYFSARLAKHDRNEPIAATDTFQAQQRMKIVSGEGTLRYKANVYLMILAKLDAKGVNPGLTVFEYIKAASETTEAMAQRDSTIPTLGLQASPTDDQPDHSDRTTEGETTESEAGAIRVEIPADEFPGLREAIARQVQEQLRSGKLPGLQQISL